MAPDFVRGAGLQSCEPSVLLDLAADLVVVVGLHRHRARVPGGHGPGVRTGSRGLSRQGEAVSTQALLGGVARPERCPGAGSDLGPLHTFFLCGVMALVTGGGVSRASKNFGLRSRFWMTDPE